jgi:hypothetical protein
MRMVAKEEGKLGEDCKLKLVGCLIILDILYQFLSLIFVDFKETLCRISLNERMIVQFISCWSLVWIIVKAFSDKIFAFIRNLFPCI